MNPLTVDKLPHYDSNCSKNVKTDEKAAVDLLLAIEAFLQVFLLRQLLNIDMFSLLSSVSYLHALF